MSNETGTDISVIHRQGVCLQDFETTLQSVQNLKMSPQPFADETHLCGLLTMSVLWNKLSYIYDTAVGDNPHLIRSFLLGAEHKLYKIFETYVRNGVVSCLVRDKLTLSNVGVVDTSPNITRIFAGWRESYGNRRDLFLTQIFDEDRDRYNRNVDQLLDGPGHPISRYNHDDSKPVFRSLMQKSLSEGGLVATELLKLPQEIQTAYQRICYEKKRFTMVDLWYVIKDLPSAWNLLVVQAYINQQAIANSLSAGVSGSNWGHSWKPDIWYPQSSMDTDEPASVEELIENADIRVKIPTLELIGLLEPEDVLELRKNAPFEIRKEQYENFSDFKIKVSKMNEEYWEQICNKIETKFFNKVKKERVLYGWILDKSPFKFKRFLSPNYFKQLVETTIIDGATGTSLPKFLKIWFLYKDSELMRKTRLWPVESYWSVHKDDNRQDLSKSRTKKED